MVRRWVLHSVRAVAVSILLAGTLLCAEPLPEALTDDAFWKLIQTISEPGGSFASDNFVSNERGYGAVLPVLRQASHPNAVFIGVGPEQNFTFVAALKPRIAFIVDIRRENMLQHLLYKALFELSENRAEFVSRLFSRKFTRDVSREISATELLRSLEPTASDKFRHAEDTKLILDTLTRRHGFPLSESDVKAIRYIHDSFFQFGSDINYNSGRLSSGRVSNAGSRMPTYVELVAATDSEGAAGNYLANESVYSVVRQMHLKNLIVPVTGDFAGSKALRAIGQYLREHEARVAAFYTSNVESYLFEAASRGAVPNDSWDRFIANLRALPADASSPIVRTPSRNVMVQPGGNNGGFLDSLATAPIQKVIEAVDRGGIREYADLFR